MGGGFPSQEYWNPFHEFEEKQSELEEKQSELRKKEQALQNWEEDLSFAPDHPKRLCEKLDANLEEKKKELLKIESKIDEKIQDLTSICPGLKKMKNDYQKRMSKKEFEWNQKEKESRFELLSMKRELEQEKRELE